jgi:hypothetical protein
MTDLSQLNVGLDDNCEVCGTSTVTVVGDELVCRGCATSRGKLSGSTLQFLRDTIRVFGAVSEPVMIIRAMKDSAMDRNTLFPSKFLKAADLNGRPTVVVIERVSVETLKNMSGESTQKLVLYFRDRQKGFVVNKTNYDTIADFLGDGAGNWIGKQIELYPDRVAVGGKTVPCIRVRQPLADELDDSVE